MFRVQLLRIRNGVPCIRVGDDDKESGRRLPDASVGASFRHATAAQKLGRLLTLSLSSVGHALARIHAD